MRSQMAWAVAVVCLMAHLAAAQTTQPGNGRAARFGQRLQELMGQLDLTEDQKQKVDDIIQQAKQQFKDQLPALRDATPEQRQAKIREIMEGVRQEIGDLLTPEQKEKLQLLMKKDRRGASSQPSDNQTGSDNQRANRLAATALRRRTFTAPATRPSETAAAEPAFSGAAVSVGQTAPDVTLHWMTGNPLHISGFKKSVVVLIFGSYSTPAFRDKATELPRLAESYNGRAKFVIVYTKEAHPSDGWTVERNKHDDVEIPQPTDMAGRRAAAEQAMQALHLTNIPIALDSMDDTAAQAYGAFPDGVVIIGKDGKITARQNWLEPTALPAMIDHALKN